MKLCSIFNVPTTHTLCTPFVRERTFSLSASSKIATLGRGIKLPGMMGAGGGGKVKKKEGKTPLTNSCLCYLRTPYVRPLLDDITASWSCLVASLELRFAL